jgi:C4-dicarboxylate-specific signal transduction histidine kinase
VVLTGLNDEELALAAVQQGAQDYLVKGEIDSRLLSRSLRYAIERKKAEAALQAARDELEKRVEERTAELRAANVRLQREIADRKLTEEKEREHREQLARVSRLNTMGEMASVLAHEMNQPLTAIVGYTRSSLRRLRADPWNAVELAQMLEKVAGEAKRGGEILKRLRRLVRKRLPERLRFDVNDAVREVLAMIEPEARTQEVSVSFQTRQETLPVFADRIQIEQVLLNLVRNGIEAMADRETKLRELTVTSGMKEAGTVEVTVSDSGRGGAISDLGKLFEPFFSTKPAGLGMGLSISRTIIETHGGRLVASPSVGGGLAFRFMLPSGGAAVRAECGSGG